MPTTKEQILNDLALLPLNKLERLQKYANNIIIPEEDLLLNVTMIDMLEKAFKLADIHFPEWTDRSEGDFGRFLVELMAVFSEKDFYYINGFANESFLSKMNMYADVFTKAVELGYSPITCKAAECTFNVEFEPSATPYTYNPGTLILEYKDKKFKFTNIAPIIVPASVIPINIPLLLYEGTLLTETQVYNGSRFNLRQTMIDVESIKLTLDNIVWDRVRVFGQSDSTSRHFAVLPDELGSAVIYFGDEGYGAVPPIDITGQISFIKCNGTKPNGVLDTIVINKQSPSRKITSVSINGLPINGREPETRVSIINNALLYFSTKFTVNNATNVQRWLEAQVEVKRSHSLVQGNIVYFRVHPNSGIPASLGDLLMFESRIAPYLSGGYEAQGIPTGYINIPMVDVEVFYLTGYNENNIKELTKNLISDYTNALILNDYGKGFKLSEIEFLLKSKIAGIQNVVFLTPASNVLINDHELLQTIPISNINVTAYAI